MRKHFNANELRVRLEEEQQKVIGMIQSGGHAGQDPSSRASTPNATNIQLEVITHNLLYYKSNSYGINLIFVPHF